MFWTTAGNRDLLISGLEDRHILNIIAYRQRNGDWMTHSRRLQYRNVLVEAERRGLPTDGTGTAAPRTFAAFAAQASFTTIPATPKTKEEEYMDLFL